MSQPARRRSSLRAVVMCAIVLAINIVVVILPHTSIFAWIMDCIYPRGAARDFAELRIMDVLGNILSVEIGCLVLWTILSGLAIHRKLAICFGVAFIAEVLSQTIKLSFFSTSFFIGHRSYYLLLSWFISITTMLVFMAIAVQLSYRKIQFVKLEESSESDRRIGIPIFQMLYLVTLLAFAFASGAYLTASFEASKNTPGRGEIPTHFHVLAAFQSGVIRSVMLLVGLLIAIRFRQFWLQLIVGLLATELAILVFRPARLLNLEDALLATIHTGLPIFAPIFWLKVVESMGYAVRCFDRKPKHSAEHPFMEHDAAKESAFE